MIIYLAHAKANYGSELDGYVMGLRSAEHDQVLHSFVYTDGARLPIGKEEQSDHLPSERSGPRDHGIR